MLRSELRKESGSAVRSTGGCPSNLNASNPSRVHTIIFGAKYSFNNQAEQRSNRRQRQQHHDSRRCLPCSRIQKRHTSSQYFTLRRESWKEYDIPSRTSFRQIPILTHQQLKELMADHIAATHKNEDYTPRYLMTEQLDTDEPALHMFET